ncbi:M10 family metallopeptidase C-terminal domain-containing protein, partial [Microvirga roseola]|uniref:M10 family metallopeptidase C-terminal domain-containing protein n=1 Tax=Microvirga roseola TaxID=2883126 RepID=UPI001E4C9FDD
TIVGGQGSDWLIGGTGRDIFWFDVDAPLGAGNVDTIEDFATGEDKFQLSRSVFTNASGGTYIDSWSFAVGSAATSSSHRIVYNQATGDLFYDADGSGAAAAQVKFAAVTAGSTLNWTHFLLV